MMSSQLDLSGRTVHKIETEK